MNLYKVEIRTKKRQRTLEAIVHACAQEDAAAYLAGKFPGCEISGWIELEHTPKHFVIAELEAA